MAESMMQLVLHVFYRAMAVAAVMLASAGSSIAAAPAWDEIVTRARGQTVSFNAWAGDPETNAFIAFVGSEALKRYGVKLQQVKLKDTAEAVSRVIAEKTAGRDQGGTV